VNGSLITVEDRPALHFERRLDHSVERVWRAISEPDELRRWYPGIPKWELERGASFTNEEGQGGGQITEVDPPTVLAYSWEMNSFVSSSSVGRRTFAQYRNLD
jgi:uncharacterized protein YndB with AHSA1/START domain